MTLQERMVMYRAKENLTQKELAERVGISVQTINSIENETQMPSRLTQAKIELVISGRRDR